MKRPLLGTMSALLLALCVVAARTEESSDTIVVRVQPAVASDTVTFDVAFVGLDYHSAQLATTPWQLRMPAEAPVTIVFRNVDRNEAMVVEVIRCLDAVCNEQQLFASDTDEVTVVTFREGGVAVGGLPSR